jgi:hypothetical protein
MVLLNRLDRDDLQLGGVAIAAAAGIVGVPYAKLPFVIDGARMSQAETLCPFSRMIFVASSSDHEHLSIRSLDEKRDAARTEIEFVGGGIEKAPQRSAEELWKSTA